MGIYNEEDFDDVDPDRNEEEEDDYENEEDDDKDTLEELFVTNDGHVVEGKNRSRRDFEDEYEENFDFEEHNSEID